MTILNACGNYAACAAVAALAIFLPTETVQAENWTPVTGSETLTKLVSGATAQIELQQGGVAVGKYFADGTAEIEAFGETIERTWQISGEDQVCYSSFTETHCYTFEQDLDQPENYRVSDIEDGEKVYFRIEAPGDGDRLMVRNDPAEEMGGLATPSAAEIAAQLSDPNTNLGTLNTQIDFIAFDGDLPEAGSQNATRITFQPSLPYKLNESTNLFIRPAIPLIVKQDIPTGIGSYESKEFELGDISFDASMGKTLSGNR